MNKLWDKGDYCLRASLYLSGKWSVSLTRLDYDLYFEMIKECWLDKWHGFSRKSSQYWWSSSGSENPKENTFFKRPTKWIYDNILKHLGLDIPKGLNHDQFRSYFITLYLRHDWLGALKVVIGLVLRFGFTPSLTEHCILKPQAYVLLTKIKCPYNINYLWYPIHLFCLMFFYFSVKRNLKIPVLESTTNKISLLPTMKLLGFKMPDDNYIKSVYEEYFKPGTDVYFIGEAICNGLIDSS